MKQVEKIKDQLVHNKEKFEEEEAKLKEDVREYESDIYKLKYIIAEAQKERDKQRRDYEMVLNERDILGT